MEPITILGLGALMLLILENARAVVDEFKQKFANEFMAIMKFYHAELLQLDLNHLKNVYETLLNDFETTSAEEQLFQLRLETIQEIQSEMGETITVDIIKKIRSFMQAFMSDIASFSTEQRDIKNVLNLYESIQKQDTKVFQYKIYETFHKMYKVIPNEELTANPEYTEIDRTMKRVLKPVKNYTERQNFLEYLLIFKLLDDFFDVPEYKELLSFK